MNKKRTCQVIIIFLGIIVLTQLYLITSGWYQEQVPIMVQSGMTSGWDPSYAETKDDNTSHEKLGSVGLFFWTFSDAHVKYELEATVKQGSFDVIVHDITEAGLRHDTTAGLEEVYHETFSKTGNYEIDLSNLPLDRMYFISIYENPDCSFTAEMMSDATICRWMLMHDNYLTNLPFVEEKYDPFTVRLGHFDSLE